MNAPPGSAFARVMVGITRRITHLMSRRLIVGALMSGLAAAAAAPVLAQEEPAPQPAIMARLAPQSLLLDAAQAGDAIVVVGERGHILVSTDSGASWRQSEVPTRSMLTAVTFHDDRLGWAVGHDSAILRSRDAGTTWELVHWAPDNEEPLFDIWFRDADTGLAVGAYGSYYRTTDGGDSWEFELIGDMDWHLHEIARAADGTMYLAAEAGVIYRSDDGGSSWIELPSPYEGSFFGVLPLAGDTVLVYGLRGHLFRSEDQGSNWNTVDTGTVAMLTTGIELSDGTVLIAGLGGTVLTSDDKGRSFRLHQREGRRGISSVDELDDGSLVVTGEFGVRVTTLGELVGESD